MKTKNIIKKGKLKTLVNTIIVYEFKKIKQQHRQNTFR